MLNAALLLAAIASVTLTTEGDITEAIKKHQGGVIYLGEGSFELKNPAVITEDTVIIGVPGNTFIRAQRGAFGNYAWLTLRDLGIWRADFDTETSTRAIGLMVQGRFDAERVQLENFTVGLYIYADSDSFGTNANGWSVEHLRIFSSAHAGMIVRGRDANGGSARHVRIMASCDRASKWKGEFGDCMGLKEQAFFGNGYDDLIISTTSERRPGQYIKLPAFMVLGDSNHSVIRYVYCERDQSSSWLAKASMALGGLCTGVRGPGLRVDGPMFSGAEFVNDQMPNNTVRARFGNAASPGSFECLVGDAIDKSRPLCTQSIVTGTELKQRCYVDRIANQMVVGRVCQDGSAQ